MAETGAMSWICCCCCFWCSSARPALVDDDVWLALLLLPKWNEDDEEGDPRRELLQLPDAIADAGAHYYYYYNLAPVATLAVLWVASVVVAGEIHLSHSRLTLEMRSPPPGRGSWVDVTRGGAGAGAWQQENQEEVPWKRSNGNTRRIKWHVAEMRRVITAAVACLGFLIVPRLRVLSLSHL